METPLMSPPIAHDQFEFEDFSDNDANEVLLALGCVAASLAYAVPRDEDPQEEKVVAHVHEHTHCSSHDSQEGPVDGYNPDAPNHQVYEVSPSQKLAAELAGNGKDESECDSDSDESKKDSDSDESNETKGLKKSSKAEKDSSSSEDSCSEDSSDEDSDEKNLQYEFVFRKDKSKAKQKVENINDGIKIPEEQFEACESQDVTSANLAETETKAETSESQAEACTDQQSETSED
ncbi:hypothetical protein J6590_101385 [Homalodisca vitripennis]|nr:hypothetical protein J6590_101385 [Homalodisca vitripennis]